MKTSDFDYSLPTELIAQTPVEPRDQSRIMVLSRSGGSIEHRRFVDIVDYLRAGDVLVFNDSRVRSEEHTSELQSHSFISYAVFCLKKKKK